MRGERRVSGLVTRWTWQLSALLLCVICVRANADEGLDKAIQQIVHQPHFKQAHWGAFFVDRKNGQPVYEYNVHKLFAPASTTKLFSTACALDALGADHRFQTPVVRHGEINDQGELKGDLILIASGDLSFGDGRPRRDIWLSRTPITRTQMVTPMRN